MHGTPLPSPACPARPSAPSSLRSMAPADVAAVQSLLRADPVVQYVTDTKTEEIGAGMYRFKAEVAWDGDQVVGRYLDR